MRFHHILTVSEKALTSRLGDRLALERELGRAVLTACLGASVDVAGPELIAQREVIAKQGLVRYVDEFGSQDLAVFVCSQGRLQPSGSCFDSYVLTEAAAMLAADLKHVRTNRC
ncbi:hypothetical protein B0E52_01545 [Rhodanobacter sp. C06]|uniref:hypothetical protein n=1 Tax=Rhodanobacter sp. C06 TaxID=1945854 RepID=UPI0009874AF7|nr:hypothetical protein [Rhodanobacter sp. C06]OOG49285.1 hypothetical protein B0E52_01545 [Rhodanobacter sp. C06]